jgi:crotonobetainyl-CoA:carnitine CoA-transferase CaiB-like acyl-CoA transferase
LSELLIKHTTQYWLQLFNKNNIPCGPINNLEQVFNDEYTIERDMVRHINRHDYQSIPSVANPVKFSNYNITYDKAPPSLGEHTNKILAENLSYTAEQIKELRDKEII